MPYQIIYSSSSTTPMQMDDLEDILEGARESNAEAGICGALVYVDGHFLQILEGDAEALLQLMGRISRDVRHEKVTVLRQAEVAAAMFSDWTMAYVSATAEEVAQWAGLSGKTAAADTLADIHGDALKVVRMAEQIFGVLSREPGGSSAAE